jgi:hypothetical protein
MPCGMNPLFHEQNLAISKLRWSSPSVYDYTSQERHQDEDVIGTNVSFTAGHRVQSKV